MICGIGYHIKGKEMGGARSKYGGEEKCVQGFGMERLMEDISRKI
jgi:hypothetical protein